MKGMVFTEFMEMIEEKFSIEMLEQVIEKADLPHQGAYTSAGNYPHAELVKLIHALSELSGRSVDDLLEYYGEYLLASFATHYPRFFLDASDCFDFLKRVDEYIYVEVRKLYADACPPTIRYEQASPAELRLNYHSHRQMAHLALGLIRGSITHFGENIDLSMNCSLSKTEGDATFILRKQD